jgi:hypothetical protein
MTSIVRSSSGAKPETLSDHIDQPGKCPQSRNTFTAGADEVLL